MLKEITKKELIEITQNERIGLILDEFSKECVNLNLNNKDELFLFIHNFMANKLNKDFLTESNFATVCFAGLILMHVETILMTNKIMKTISDINLAQLETDGKIN